ncbi:methyltransferase [Paludisphaera mucosa]|uniref:Methyltransferase n=1 Tax=Paludisphaera mucosa TaxID=3030827 RepID=A0ABT6FDA8_9BACT|nr:methyltransferase [Paludisphaera mucosa]MDG3005555.1 methyltransferase [Paludisphaera mucosa]
MDEPTPQDRAFQVLAGYWGSQAVLAAAKLGIADHLAEHPRSAGQLAESLGADAPSLARLLRALVGLGVLHADQGRYGLTSFGQVLRTGVPGSMKSFFLGVMADDHRRAWGELAHSVRTGETAFDHIFGMPCFDYYARHPELSADFNDAMTAGSAAVESAATEAYDFTRFGRIADVGGGNGGFLSAVLASAPEAEGILFDTPAGLAGAKNLLKSRGVSGRCDVVPGDFFESVPSGGDLYMLKWILHDWEDRRAAAILRNCRKAAPRGAHVLLVEVVLPDGDEPTIGHLGDLNMMVMTGGRERTAGEFRSMLEAAGFSNVRVVPTRSPFALVEAEVAG